ncbi:hypothetical protein [Acrocarpospora sp. B8E8]|uniref:hypothetical protein n=1 Tax=Acrocarpospora sp. B8E8 TaxID=3153572 RepID=UPI00325FCE6C
MPFQPERLGLGSWVQVWDGEVFRYGQIQDWGLVVAHRDGNRRHVMTACGGFWWPTAKGSKRPVYPLKPGDEPDFDTLRLF